MLYSLISAVAPSKCFSQTKVSSRTRLFARPNIPEFRMASSSARSASNLLMDEYNGPSPRENSSCVSQSGFLGESIPQFPRKGCLAESLNPDEIRAESKNESLFPEGFMAESVFESGIPSKRSSGSPKGVGLQENH